MELNFWYWALIASEVGHWRQFTKDTKMAKAAALPFPKPLLRLVGTWTGKGKGTFPTFTQPFEYLETVCFEHRGLQPFLSYSQQTTHAQKHVPMHSESGFWRYPCAFNLRSFSKCKHFRHLRLLLTQKARVQTFFKVNQSDKSKT